MKETAEKEGYYQDIAAQYELMLEKVTPSKDRDLDKFKKEITLLLEEEIVSRYFYQEGRAKQQLYADRVVQKGIEILQDSKQYDTILKN